MTFSPLTIRRLKNFRSNKRGYYSTLIFCVLFFISIFAEFIANDKPIFVFFEQKIHFPVFEKISETQSDKIAALTGDMTNMETMFALKEFFEKTIRSENLDSRSDNFCFN